MPTLSLKWQHQLDSYLKSEIIPATKAVDKKLATIQSHVLDAHSPLSAILETKADVPEETVTAATDAIKLMGNANAQISHLRRTKVISQMNKALLPLVDEDSTFREVSPSLFGPEFAQKSKQLVDQVKAMRSPLDTFKLFFNQAPPTAGGLLSQANMRRGRSPERMDNSGKVVPEEHVEQVTHAHTYSKHVIMNWKSTLLNQIACLGVEHNHQPDLPQAGR